jgi:hypothetical protein
MLKKFFLATLLVGAVALILGLESSLIPLYSEICEKTKDTGVENCAPYNFVSYALLKSIAFLDSINTVVTAVSTFAVAIFTYTLSKSTKDLYAVTKTAADAADLSARAAIAIQLPVIRIRPDELSWGDSNVTGIYMAHIGVGQLTFSNLGASKAFPIDLKYGFTIGKPLEETPAYLFAASFVPNLIFEPDPNTTPFKSLGATMVIEPEQWPLICEGRLDVWFYCVFAYYDFMQSRHEAAFCWHWEKVGFGMAWRADPTPAYSKKT